jgi:hypothetical protein
MPSSPARISCVPPPQWASRSRTRIRHAPARCVASAARARPFERAEAGSVLGSSVVESGRQRAGDASLIEHVKRCCDRPAVRGADRGEEVRIPAQPAGAREVGWLAGPDRPDVRWGVDDADRVIVERLGLGELHPRDGALLQRLRHPACFARRVERRDGHRVGGCVIDAHRDTMPPGWRLPQGARRAEVSPGARARGPAPILRGRLSVLVGLVRERAPVARAVRDRAVDPLGADPPIHDVERIGAVIGAPLKGRRRALRTAG